MKYLRVKYDTALQDVVNMQCFNAISDEQAIDTQVTLMWLFANPKDSIEWQIYKPLTEDANETTLFDWDTFAILSFEDENTIEVFDVY